MKHSYSDNVHKNKIREKNSQKQIRKKHDKFSWHRTRPNKNETNKKRRTETISKKPKVKEMKRIKSFVSWLAHKHSNEHFLFLWIIFCFFSISRRIHSLLRIFAFVCIFFRWIWTSISFHIPFQVQQQWKSARTEIFRRLSVCECVCLFVYVSEFMLWNWL